MQSCVATVVFSCFPPNCLLKFVFLRENLFQERKTMSFNYNNFKRKFLSSEQGKNANSSIQAKMLSDLFRLEKMDGIVSTHFAEKSPLSLPNSQNVKDRKVTIDDKVYDLLVTSDLIGLGEAKNFTGVYFNPHTKTVALLEKGEIASIHPTHEVLSSPTHSYVVSPSKIPDGYVGKVGGNVISGKSSYVWGNKGLVFSSLEDLLNYIKKNDLPVLTANTILEIVQNAMILNCDNRASAFFLMSGDSAFTKSIRVYDGKLKLISLDSSTNSQTSDKQMEEIQKYFDEYSFPSMRNVVTLFGYDFDLRNTLKKFVELGDSGIGYVHNFIESLIRSEFEDIRFVLDGLEQTNPVFVSNFKTDLVKIFNSLDKLHGTMSLEDSKVVTKEIITLMLEAANKYQKFELEVATKNQADYDPEISVYIYNKMASAGGLLRFLSIDFTKDVNELSQYIFNNVKNFEALEIKILNKILAKNGNSNLDREEILRLKKVVDEARVSGHTNETTTQNSKPDDLVNLAVKGTAVAALLNNQEKKEEGEQMSNKQSNTEKMVEDLSPAKEEGMLSRAKETFKNDFSEASVRTGARTLNKVVRTAIARLVADQMHYKGKKREGFVHDFMAFMETPIGTAMLGGSLGTIIPQINHRLPESIQPIMLRIAKEQRVEAIATIESELIDVVMPVVKEMSTAIMQAMSTTSLFTAESETSSTDIRVDPSVAKAPVSSHSETHETSSHSKQNSHRNSH